MDYTKTSDMIRLEKKIKNNKYICYICKQGSKYENIYKKHLLSKSHIDNCKEYKLKLEQMSEKDLNENYNTTNIDDIIMKMSNSKYEFKKQKKSGKIIFSLSDEKKQENKEEADFKNIFKLMLKKWHDLLSGAGTTGDPALDDIMNIMMLCYLQDFLDDELFDFKNLKYYGYDDIYEEYFKCLNINELLKDTLAIRPVDGSMSTLEQVGEVFILHPLTKNIITDKGFINCKKQLIIVKLIKEIRTFTQTFNIFQKYSDIIGIAYEYWMNTYKGNSGQELGNYFTERELMRMCFELIDEKDIEEFEINDDSTIGDEFCGTYGFPLYLRQYLKQKFNINIKDKNMYGVEFEDRAARFAIMNAMFSMKDFKNIVKGDSFHTNVRPHLDISVHNVPFGDRMKAILVEEDYDRYRDENEEQKLPLFKEIVGVKKNTDAVLASQVALYKTNKIGLCIIKDGKETSGKNMKNYRKYFCENCVIKKILKIPSGCFTSTGTKTVCIYFIKKQGHKTENIQFLQLDEKCSKITELCNVSIADLKHNDYSWNPDVYIMDEEMEKMMDEAKCEFKRLGDICEFEKKSKRKASFGKNTGKYPFIKSSMVVNKFVDIADFNKPSFIIGDGGLPNINYCEQFSTSDHCYVLHNENKITTKYIYYYLKNNIKSLDTLYVGATLKNISKTSIANIMLPMPPLEIQKKTVEIIDDLDEQIKLLEKKIILYKKQQKQTLKQSFVLDI